MAQLGQASGGWTESSSALRLLHKGVRNTTGILTADAFTQTNPPITTTAGTVSEAPGLHSEIRGVLSGSVAFTRPDVGGNYVGGPVTSGLTLPVSGAAILPVGVFVNIASGNAYENIPGAASGKGTYMSGLGTYGNALFETQTLVATTGTVVALGTDLTYIPGMKLVASRNGYLMPTHVFSGGALVAVDNTAGGGAYNSLEAFLQSAVNATTIAICKMAPDSAVNELVYDQRI